MADEVVEKTDVVEDKSKPETVLIPEEKKFTQAELNSTVQNRVKREKDALTAAQSQWTAKEEEYAKQIETYEKVLANYVKAEMDGLTDLESKAISRLPVLEQIELLSEAKKTNKSNMPITPKAKQNSNIVPNKKFNNPFGG
jgi:hypothetical protein